MNTVEKLDQLDDFQSQRDLIALQKQEAMVLAFPEELRKILDDIEVEFSGKAETVDLKISELEKEIKNEILLDGTSVKGTYLHAVWNKGRTSWNTSALNGYAEAHPEVKKFQKFGNPSVSIRKRK